MSYFHSVVSCFLSVFLFCCLQASDFEDDAWIVSSPMPGCVERVFVAEGTFVERGTPLYISEAMKMSMTVTAQRPGYVYAVFMKAGDVISASQHLISFQKNPVNQDLQTDESSLLVNDCYAPEDFTEEKSILSEHLIEDNVDESYSVLPLVAKMIPQGIFEEHVPQVKKILFDESLEEGDDFLNDDMFLASQDEDGGSPPILTDGSLCSQNSVPMSLLLSHANTIAKPYLSMSFAYDSKFCDDMLENQKGFGVIEEVSPFMAFSQNINIVLSDMRFFEKDKTLYSSTPIVFLLFGEKAPFMFKKAFEHMLVWNSFFQKNFILNQFAKTSLYQASFVQGSLFEEALVILKTSWRSLWFLSSQPIGILSIVIAILLSCLPSPRQTIVRLTRWQAAYVGHLSTPEASYTKIKNNF